MNATRAKQAMIGIHGTQQKICWCWTKGTTFQQHHGVYNVSRTNDFRPCKIEWFEASAAQMLDHDSKLFILRDTQVTEQQKTMTTQHDHELIPDSEETYSRDTRITDSKLQLLHHCTVLLYNHYSLKENPLLTRNIESRLISHRADRTQQLDWIDQDS